MTAISGSGRFPQPNLLADRSERVFLCRSAAEKSHQLRSRGTQRLVIHTRVRLAFSLAAALSGQERVSAREGWAGETDEIFERLILQANPKAVNI
ncbi:MAG: hypothetical protein LZF86_190473 [Nitrospira sp.]|nr:MAG: hypothetical protein LZF86_190473 [Nitrospira sp.]